MNKPNSAMTLSLIVAILTIVCALMFKNRLDSLSSKVDDHILTRQNVQSRSSVSKLRKTKVGHRKRRKQKSKYVREKSSSRESSSSYEESLDDDDDLIII